MKPEDEKEFLEEIKDISDDDLMFSFKKGYFGDPDSTNDKRLLVEIVLEKREKEKINDRFEKMLQATKDNADSTKHLGRATWGLVIVTALLVLFTYLRG